MWKETAVAYFKSLTQHMPRGTEETYNNSLSHWAKDSEMELSEHKAGVKTTNNILSNDCQ
jgi:hypothetical protein